MSSLVTGNVSAPNQQPVNVQSTYGAATGDIAGLSGTYGGLGGSVLPQAQQTTQNLVNNPFAGQALTGAQTASSLGQAGAQTNFNTGQSLVPYAQSIINTGFDPQNALFQQELQQVRDQSNVNNAQAGVATTPYGAGLTNQATSNFDLQWQNNQLQRNVQAAQAAGQLDQTASGLYTPSGSQEVQAASIPYATYSDIGTGQNTALSQLLGIGQAGAKISNMSISDLLAQLSGGNQANQVANQTYASQLQGAQNVFNNTGTLAQSGAGVAGDLLGFLGA